MVARAAVAALVVWAAAAYAGDPTPKAVDIKPFKDKLMVFKDADNGVYVVLNDKNLGQRVFYSTGREKVFHDQLLEGGSGRNGDAWNVSVAAPRAAYPFMGTIGRREDATFYKSCGVGADVTSTVELTEVTGDKAKDILDKWQFHTTSMVRRAYMLARDDRGVYYYVDVLRDIYGGAGHRVFVGKKGGLKQMALTDVTSDSAGDVFATKTGDLRLVRTNDAADKPSAQWIRGEKKSELIYLDLYMNQPLIYRDLGLYKTSGTICGNI